MKEDTSSKILKKLRAQKKEEGNLPLLLEFYRNLLQTQSEARRRIGTPKSGLSHEIIQRRIKHRRPILGFNDLVLDWSTVQDVFVQVIAVFARYPELFGQIPEKLKKPEAGRLLTKKAAGAWFNGQELPPTLADGISKQLMQSLVQATLQPFLASYAQILIDSFDQESWRRGYCPICGGIPDLAYLEKEVGARWLLCSRCDAEWLFQRLMCPYCNNQDQRTLSFFIDDSEQYRLYVCEQCKRYLKTIDLRKAKPEILLPLERIYTMDLDSQAKEHGYKAF